MYGLLENVSGGPTPNSPPLFFSTPSPNSVVEKSVDSQLKKLEFFMGKPL